MTSFVLSSSIVTEYETLDKADIAKNLYSQLQWEQIRLNGVNLEQSNRRLLDEGQAHLDSLLDSLNDSQLYVSLLIAMAENCSDIPTVQKYVFTKMEEILGLGPDYSDTGHGAFGLKHAHLFTTDGTHLIDSFLMRALPLPDTYVQKSASLCFAALLTVCEGNLSGLVDWIKTAMKQATTNFDIALPALTMLSRSQSIRSSLVSKGIVTLIVQLLKKIGANGNAQQLYELCFVLWALSLDNVDKHEFLASGAVPLLVDLTAAAPTRKVMRMCLSTLRDLSADENDLILNEMLSCGLLKTIETIVHTNAAKQADDVDVEQDVRFLYDIMLKNYRELTTFDRWCTEIRTENVK